MLFIRFIYYKFISYWKAMNKTTHKKVYSRNKEILTQSDFRKQRPYSPIKSQKSTDDSPQT